MVEPPPLGIRELRTRADESCAARLVVGSLVERCVPSLLGPRSTRGPGLCDARAVADALTASSGLEEKNAARLTELVGGYRLSQIVRCMARLDIATHLAGGTCSSADLAGGAGAQPSLLRRFLRAAVGIGLLREIERDRFGLTPWARCSCRATATLLCASSRSAFRVRR
jgi:hypothetical protein